MGEYTSSDLLANHIAPISNGLDPDYTLKGLKVPKGWGVVLFAQDNFEGENIFIQGPITQDGPFDFVVASMRVVRTDNLFTVTAQWTL